MNEAKKIFSFNGGHTEEILARIPGFPSLQRDEDSRQITESDMALFLAQILPDERHTYRDLINVGRDERNHTYSQIDEEQMTEILGLLRDPINQMTHIVNLQLAIVRSIHVELRTRPTMALYLGTPETLQDPEVFGYFLPGVIKSMPMLLDTVEFFSSDEAIDSLNEIVNLIEHNDVSASYFNDSFHPLSVLYDLFAMEFPEIEKNSHTLADLLEDQLLSDQPNELLIGNLTPELRADIEAYIERVRNIDFNLCWVKVMPLITRLYRYSTRN